MLYFYVLENDINNLLGIISFIFTLPDSIMFHIPILKKGITSNDSRTIIKKRSWFINNYCISSNILLAHNYTKSLQQVFTFMILLANLAGLPVYASTTAEEIRLSININNEPSKIYIIKKSIIPAIAFIYSLWVI